MMMISILFPIFIMGERKGIESQGDKLYSRKV
jgi:hypothetical protein